MITQIEGCGSNDRHSNHMKHHMKFINDRVLTTIVDVLELGECRKESRSQYMVVFYLTTFPDVNHSKFQVYEVHFHAESIGASPVIIACKTGELFWIFFYYRFSVLP